MHARKEIVCSVMLFMLSSFIVDASVELSFPNNERMNNSEVYCLYVSSVYIIEVYIFTCVQDAAKGLMYAEVGLQQKQSEKTGFLNLDDHIEYAKLKHHQPDTATDTQLQPLVENTPK